MSFLTQSGRAAEPTQAEAQAAQGPPRPTRQTMAVTGPAKMAAAPAQSKQRIS